MTIRLNAAEVSTLIDDVIASVKRRLRHEDSSLILDTVLEDELSQQIEHIVARTMARLNRVERHSPAHESRQRGIAVGDQRAKQNVHPADSLTAATILFDVALAKIVNATGPDADAERVARALNTEIMENVIPASVAYVNVLLERLAVAHSEERFAISRELHDRVAHGIVAGIQRIVLNEQPGSTESDSRRRTGEALELLTSALTDTRSLALDLRHIVGDKRLDQALRDYAEDLGEEDPNVFVETFGTPRRVPSGVQEEAFIIIREAIRNAQRHSGAERIVVRTVWEPSLLHMVVSDNGHGFRHDRVRSGAFGLIAAQERAELIGADLTIEPGIDVGTTVTLTVPIGDWAP